ncbi:HDOD domain-containing protein [Nitrococcus mobilis]|uniref:HD domain protein n=1 Tax=Nitrococcus mobilis Nb-231 TaxID=314278 RepID=A4BU72_9GAMM|nr:HDOD domain-containing protein [Nitrococcus mobilis]EAR20746.1 HD domain protein [Nitrococcus mobilis Nb-231]
MTADEIAAHTANLASLPRAYHRINEMLADTRYSVADIGKVIRHEPALTARLLRLVNSAYFGLATRIDSVPLAISVLGIRALHELVLATSVASAFARIDTQLVDVADFWHHSVYCGIMARLLSKRLRIAESEQIFVAGLLHDIGKLAIYQQLPEHSEQVLSRFADSNDPLYRVEQKVLGFTHAAVGKALLHRWGLPAVFCEVTAYHHHPNRSRHYRDESWVVHAADALSAKIEPGHKITRDHTAPPSFEPNARPRIALTASLAEELAVDADAQSIEVYGMLFGNPLP